MVQGVESTEWAWSHLNSHHGNQREGIVGPSNLSPGRALKSVEHFDATLSKLSDLWNVGPWGVKVSDHVMSDRVATYTERSDGMHI